MEGDSAAADQTLLRGDFRRFLRIFILVVLLNAVANAALGLAFGTFALWAFSGAAGTVLGFALLSWRLVAKGRDQQAVLLLAAGIYFATVVTTALVPAVYPTMCIGTAVGFALALPYIQGRPLAFLAVASMLSTGAIVLLGEMSRWFPEPPQSLAVMLVVTTVISGMVLLLVQLMQFSARSHRSVSGLKRALATREEFLSVASHELRTPMTALNLQLQMLERALKSSSSENGVELTSKVSTARRQADRLARLVDRLLDVTRLQSGQLTLNVQACDLCAVAREVAERCAEDARQHGCTLSVDAAAPVVGQWDALRLEQVVQNLLSNAIKYAPRTQVTLKVDASDRHGVVSVTDGGPGIAASDVDRIFMPFERGVAAGQHGGLGLGLYIVRQIVDAHGGSVSVASASPSGATFTVRLPTEPRADLAR